MRTQMAIQYFHSSLVRYNLYVLTDSLIYLNTNWLLTDFLFVPDLTADPDELTNVAIKFPVIVRSLDKILRSVVNYPKVSSSVQEYNKRQFISWKQSLGQNYSNVIANLRWHQDWLKEPKKYQNAIDKWLSQSK